MEVNVSTKKNIVDMGISSNVHYNSTHYVHRSMRWSFS